MYCINYILPLKIAARLRLILDHGLESVNEGDRQENNEQMVNQSELEIGSTDF